MRWPNDTHSLVQESAFYQFESIFFESKFKHPVILSLAEANTIDYMWRLFNNLPRGSVRFDHVHRATNRLLHRRAASALPPRDAYTSTVDYYEALLPLLTARHIFRRDFIPETGLASLDRAVQSLVPDQLF